MFYLLQEGMVYIVQSQQYCESSMDMKYILVFRQRKTGWLDRLYRTTCHSPHCMFQQGKFCRVHFRQNNTQRDI